MAEVRQAAADEVRAATGFAVGGVPPFGHDLPVLFDEALLDHEQVWARRATLTACSRSIPSSSATAFGRASSRSAEGSASPLVQAGPPNSVQREKDAPAPLFEHPDMEPTLNDALSRIDTVWVVVAGIVFGVAGFLLLEVGYSRMKNAGTVVAKVIANLSIAALCYWAIGFALAFGGAGWFAGTEGTFLGTTAQSAFPAMEFSSAAVPAKFFQFAFCAVSLAIVWGTTLERIKFGAYLIYAVVFASLIYPVISHWIFGGGWLQASFGMQDFEPARR